MSNIETTEMTKERWDKIIDTVEDDLRRSNSGYWGYCGVKVISEQELNLIISVLKNNVPF